MSTTKQRASRENDRNSTKRVIEEDDESDDDSSAEISTVMLKELEKKITKVLALKNNAMFVFELVSQVE